MPLQSGKQRKAQLKLKRAIKRGDAQQEQQPRKRNRRPPRQTPEVRLAAERASRSARKLQSEFVKLDKTFLDATRALAGSIVLRRPIPSDVAALRQEWIAPSPPAQLSLPKRPKWRYEMSKDELDANEQAYFRTWLAQQDVHVEQWRRALNAPTDEAIPAVGDSETRLMPHPPTHFERNIEVWRQFWRVTEISQILLVLLDSRCPPLHLPPSLATYLHLPSPSPPTQRSKQSKAPLVILVLTKVDISGPACTTSWTSFLNANYPGVPVVPVEAYAPKSSIEQGHMRYEPHLPGSFRERLVHTLRDAHEKLLQPPQWVTSPRDGESEEQRLQRIDQWTPRVKRVIDWDGVLKAKGKLVGKAVGGAAVPKGQDGQHESGETEANETDDVNVSDSEDEQTEWKEPEFLTVGVIGQPNVGKSSLLNAIFGTVRVRASRTPGKTKHFQTLFWTSDVRLVDCPGLVMPSFVPMDIQVLSGVLPISRISAVSFCIHQLGRLLPLEKILELTHPAFAATDSPPSGKSTPKAKSTAPGDAISVQDKRTWRTGQRPPEQTKVREWTANDIMTAYAEKKGWVTAKAGRPDVHRAGNAILRLVAEGKVPWAFWPPGSSVSSDDGIWVKGGVQQHAWDGLESDEDEEGSESEMEELSSEEEDAEARVRIASGETDESEEDEEKPAVRGGNLGRFGALRLDD